VANLYKSKGLDILINSISLLDAELREKVLLVSIGDGPEMSGLKSLISNLKLDETIKLLGKISSASDYLKAFDIFVLPSRKEGFPYALLEAMQAGLPIIATDVGGNREAIDDAGIIISPQNPRQLANAITTLIHANISNESMKEKALTRAKLFTEEKMFSQTDTEYKKILGS